MADPRLSDLKDLNGEFPFDVPGSMDEWDKRRAALTRQLLVANGLWPMPTGRPRVRATVHGRVHRQGYTVDRVFLETSPGLYVTGSLYKPADRPSKMPAVMCPHMHTPADPGSGGGRFHDCVQEIEGYLAEGGEDYAVGGRHPLQARCVHLARNMGCAAFLYDMQGGRSDENHVSGPQACYGDGGSFNFDIIHRFAKQRPHMSATDQWGLYSAQAELRMLCPLGIHTFNSLRIVDWLESLPEIDDKRIGVTGASGGGTQTFMIAAIDPRISAAFPCVMVSTAMQGGCTCENASCLRLATGNVEIAALIAPRPLGLTAANDWTAEIETKGLPELRAHYELMGAPGNVQGKKLEFGHNYNARSRELMYDFFNRHFALDISPEDLVEQDYIPLSHDEATVWSGRHESARPVLNEALELKVLRGLDAQNQGEMASINTITDSASLAEFRRVVGGWLETVVGRSAPTTTEAAVLQPIVGAMVDSAGVSGGAVSLSLPVLSQQCPTGSHGTAVGTIEWTGEASGVVVLVTSGQIGADAERLVAERQALMTAGLAVLTLELLGADLSETPVVSDREALCYTAGYNYSLFAHRVHDVLTCVAAVADIAGDAGVHLMGTSHPAGIIVAAAGALCEAGTISSITVETNGFRFAEITDYRDVNLLPGAVKYGDLPSILALCAPTRLTMSESLVPEVVAAAYRVEGAVAPRAQPVGTRDLLGFWAAQWGDTDTANL